MGIKRSGTQAAIVADTLTGRRKQSSPSHILKKFTGTVAHDKGGVFIVSGTRAIHAREQPDNEGRRLAETGFQICQAHNQKFSKKSCLQRLRFGAINKPE
jgi:hypothetical protein